MADSFSTADISFKQMSEEEAVKEFQNDGYTDYQKRKMRYRSIPIDSVWATTPATMFVAYFENKPVGVTGYSKYKNVLFGAGIHVRDDFRGRGLTPILIDKLLSEKGSKTIYINIMNDNISSSYRKKGFKDMKKETLPEEAKEAIEGIGFSDQVQKWMLNNSGAWFDDLKKKVNAAGNYTKPTMRKKIVARLKAGSKGGPAGEWTGRKAQMVALAYKKAGGGYRD